jgi:hypothetical protein
MFFNRAHSSSALTSLAAGRVEKAPTSSTSAPSAIMVSAWRNSASELLW